MRSAGLALAALAALFAAGGARAAPGVRVSAGWVRATPPSSNVAAGYLQIDNDGADDRLLNARTPRAASVTLHESAVDGGVVRMREVGVLPVPAGAHLALKPLGRHLMLEGLKGPLRAGEHVPLELEFEHAGRVSATLAVVADTATGPPPAATAPQRIVTLAPHLTELLYAAGGGDRLVGTLDTSDYPPAARRVPRVGDVGHVDAERLLALRPDLVLLWGDGTPAEQRALLARLNLPTLSLEQHALADVPRSLEQLGELLGTQATADAAAARVRAAFAALAARYRGARPLRVFYEVWGTPLYTLGGRHVASEMLRLCGASNVFADQPQSAFMVSEEAVYARDPDAIVLAGTAAEAADWRARWGGRAPLRAVRDGAVFALDPDLVNRMGPRLVAGTAALCEALDRVRAHGASQP